MKKIILLGLILLSFAYAKGSDVATKDDVRAVKDEIIHQMDKRFEQMQHYMDKRFEQMQHYMDKRFEQMQHYMDKRFEDVNKRFEDVNRRFEDVNRRFDDVNRRFEDMDKRFEDMNDKFNMLLTVLLFGFGIVVSIVGFYIKKTYNIESEIKAVAYDVQNSHNKKYFEALVETVEELAKKEKAFGEILKKHDLLGA